MHYIFLLWGLEVEEREGGGNKPFANKQVSKNGKILQKL
jgi:hypothetical protein